tara:strand:- start:16986 stop:17735 length:750 start_codon:yes stop_codon:yes gene_type:complete
MRKGAQRWFNRFSANRWGDVSPFTQVNHHPQPLYTSNASVVLMVSPALRYWCDLYRRHKYEALALDIETEEYDGKIAVVSMSKLHRNDVAETVQLTQGCDLTDDTLFREVHPCSLLITFNGRDFDLPRIKAEYPSAVPDNIPVLDLWILAQAIGLRGGLKLLEKVFNIHRAGSARDATGRTHILWKKFVQDDDREALETLLTYAAADSKNLFALADTLIEWSEARLLVQERQSDEHTNASKFSLVFEMT